MFGQKILGSLKKDLKIAQFLIGLLQIKANLKNKVKLPDLKIWLYQGRLLLLVLKGRFEFFRSFVLKKQDAAHSVSKKKTKCGRLITLASQLRSLS